MAKDFVMLNLVVSEHWPPLFDIKGAQKKQSAASLLCNVHFSSTTGGDVGPEHGPW